MKNDFCDLPQEAIQKLRIPDALAGLLLSPFQHNRKGDYIMVPVDTFKEMTDVITLHAQQIDVESRNGL